MSILHIGGLAKDKDRDRDRERDTGSKRLERLLSTLDRDRVREVTDKVLEGTRSIGERHETISSTLQDAAAALASLKSIESGLERARRAIDVEFDTRREERSEIVALNALLEHVRHELAAGGARELDLQGRLTVSEAALSESKAGRTEAEGAAAARQAEVVRLNAVSNAARSEIAELKTILEQASKQLSQSQEDNQNLRARVEDLENLRQEAEVKIASLGQARALVEAERGALERRAEAQSNELGRLGRAVAELEGRLSAELARTRGLETTLQASQAETLRLNQAMDELNVNTKVHLETAEMRLDTAQARAGRLEDENAELNRQLQEAVVRDRVVERDIADTRQRLERTEERVKSLDSDLALARQELLAAESARAAAVERSERLNDALQVRHADVKRLEDQSEGLQARIGALEAELSSEKGSGSERARTLTDLIERERSEHSIAQGALEAARKDRARLHLELLKVARQRPGMEDLANGLDTSDEDDSPMEVKFA